MKAAIYNPYWDTLGGGERYTLTFAKVLSENGYDIDIEGPDESILEKLSDRFGFKLNKNIKVVDNVNRGDGYDLIFWVSDGSVPMLRARKNILHFQVPFHGVNGDSLLNKMKFFRIDNVVCNSEFTKKVVDSEYKINSSVLYPPIDTEKFKPKRKENIILYVGRFSFLKQSKGQEILISCFKKLIDQQELVGWKLILAGGVEVGVGDYINKLRADTVGYDIEILESPKFSKIQELYGKAKIFWSAAGFGIDSEKEPERMEHFGMSLVESMSAACLPIVYNGGGHKEIIENNLTGYLWKNEDELVEMTENIIKNKKDLAKISKLANVKSKKFSINEFEKGVLKLTK